MKTKALFLTAVILLCTACTNNTPIYSKYETTFIDVFDTYVILLGYATSDSEFNQYSQIIYDRLHELHREYDIYNDYDGINNLKTVNDNAGIAPVSVSADIIELLQFGKDAYYATGGTVNIAMGSVLSIWHDYRMAGLDDPENAALPPMEMLEKANQLTDIEDLVIDVENSTVFLKKTGMSLDVGALAKGYAAQAAIDTAKSAGMTSMLADVGGNICSVGKPMNGKDRWGVGIQDPELSVGDTKNVKDTIFINDGAVVSSGGYQRYYIVDGVQYNHIIDKETLMPSDRYSAVTVLTENAADADMLSTAVFTLTIEEGEKLLEKYGANCIWIMPDGNIHATSGYEKVSKLMSGYSSIDS